MVFLIPRAQDIFLKKNGSPPKGEPNAGVAPAPGPTMPPTLHQEAEDDTEDHEADPDGEGREAEELRICAPRHTRGQETESVVQVAVQGQENENEPGQEHLCGRTNHDISSQG